MKPTNTLLLNAAFAVYNSEPPSEDYEIEGGTIVNILGLHAVTYKNRKTNDYILSFRGTQEPTSWEGLKDWANNFNDGWPQYKSSRDIIAERVQKILEKDSNARIHIVGHSLGGALAQFAAYDVASRYMTRMNSRITLTTWNALGGKWGLAANERGYDPKLLAGIDGNHFYRHDDLVARLGGDHVGGRKIMLLDPEIKMESAYAAHMKEELVQGLEKGISIEKDPMYAFATRYSREFLGTALAGVVNLLDPKIEGMGIVNLTRTIVHATIGQGIKVAAVEVGVFLWQYLVQRIADYSTRDKDGLKSAMAEIAESVADDQKQLSWFAGKMMEGVLYEAAATSKGRGSLNHEGILWISEVFKDVANRTQKQSPQISDLFKLASKTMLEPVPGLPFSIGELFLVFKPELFAVQVGIKAILSELQTRFRQAESQDRFLHGRRQSPLVLDLDGDGIETLGTDSGVYFDHNNNGFAELTGWISPDDGLLTLDKNQNGNIDGGNELFGNHFQLSSGSQARDGFAALADLDSDLNRYIDASDARWNQLGIWQDSNMNGQVDSGELNTLTSHRIARIPLEYGPGKGIDINSNDHRQQGKFIREDGQISHLTDVWFSASWSQSRDLQTVHIDQDLSFVPDLEGTGNVPSLHQAIARDKSGELARLLQDWYAASHTQHAQLIAPILYHWSGVAQDTRKANLILEDRRILSTLEAFMGRLFRDGQDPLTSESAHTISAEFDRICKLVTGLLNSHPFFLDAMSHVRITWDHEKDKMGWNITPLLNHLRANVDHKLSTIDLLNLQRAIQSLGNTGDELLAVLKREIQSSTRDEDLKLRWLVDKWIEIGSDESELIHPLYSSAITVHGGGGDDRLITNQAQDLLDGGTGNDILDGGLGDDIYLFRKSFGHDRIHEAETHGRGLDTAVFTDHTSHDIEAIEQQKGDLILRFRSGDSCTIARYAGDAHRFERIDLLRFADGVAWRMPDILARIARIQASTGDDILTGHSGAANQINGLAGNDLIWGGGLSDQLSGHLGRDALFGGDGDDWLRGGHGRDLLVGGAGRDRYLYARADGEDTIRAKREGKPEDRGRIVFDPGVDPAKVTVSLDLDKSTLLVKTGVLGDLIRIEEFIQNDTPYHQSNPIDAVTFSDGTLWSTWDLLQRSMRGTAEADSIEGSLHNDSLHGYGQNDYLVAKAGDDHLYGHDGDDRLVGGPGNDMLYGGSGHNIYRFMPGDGQDIIVADVAANGTQRSGIIEFHADIQPDEIEFRRHGTQLLIARQPSGDSITVQDFFRDNTASNLWNPVTGIDFTASRQQLTVQDILARVPNNRTGTSGRDVLEAHPEGAYLHGLAGDDSLLASDGEDLLDGGVGVDTVSYARASQGVVVDLALRAAQDTRGAGMDTLIGIENLLGSRLADHLSGSEEANLLDGGDGDDVLLGSAGADRHRGGAGADLFLYRSAMEMGQGVRARDRILDFGAEDRLDLSRVDADPSRPGDQAFVWIGEREFHGPAQLRYTVANGQGLLKGNLNGPSRPEFTLVVEGGFRLDPAIHLLL